LPGIKYSPCLQRFYIAVKKFGLRMDSHLLSIAMMNPAYSLGKLPFIQDNIIARCCMQISADK
jgi:hypothetical protein